MKTRAAIFLGLLLLYATAGASAPGPDKPEEPNALFYQGNALYRERDYLNALLAYDKVLDLGLESANLYYNIGNGFLKLNKYGYAILFYERARRMMPYDSDTRSNLAYARSLTGEASLADTTDTAFLKAVKRPLRDLPLGALTLLAIGLYLAAALFAALRIAHPAAAKRLRYFSWTVMLVSAYTLAVFGIRYYDEVVQIRGIALQKEIECRYEPIDKSAVHFKLKEGSEVLIMATRGDWRQVRRSDGKAGWAKKTSVEAI